MKSFEVIPFADGAQLAFSAASLWLDEIEAANRAGKIYCVALSGGRITHQFFAATVALAESRHISFAHLHFFWADERCVLPTDAESNFKMANELLFAPLKIHSDQIHRIRGEEPPDVAVKMAEAELQQFAKLNENKLPALDLIFLGMGEDGHVASLFPGKTDGMNSKEIFCAVKNSPKPPPNRISLTYAAIALAKKVWILASGAGKKNALRDSLFISGNTPLARVIQSRSQTKIFTDIACN